MWNWVTWGNGNMLTAVGCLLCALITAGAVDGQQTAGVDAARTEPASPDAEGPQKATFGGGCFWCTEAVYQELKGVRQVVSGYSGGFVPNPTYKAVCTGRTGHAEVVQITYDPQQITYDELLEVFWKTHDPTTLNRQGPDIGPQYRSVVFYHTDKQRELAEYYKKKLDEAGAFRTPIVTEISSLAEFYPAEGYHQDYYNLNPRQRYCSRVIEPKIKKVRRVFREKLKINEPRTPGAADQSDKIKKTDAEWRKQLTRQEFFVTRRKGTEKAFSGEYWNSKQAGTYTCVCCKLPLFQSSTKFTSGTGWPSFWDPIERAHIATAVDRSERIPRMEVKCARCDAHLGHVFSDGPPPTGLRFCVNSVALDFESGSDER